MIPILRLDADPSDEAVLARVAAHLEGGGLIVYPTETVYGVGARADAAGVRAVRELKGREDDKPMLVLLPPQDVEDVSRGGGGGDEGDQGSSAARGRWGLVWNPLARELARRFWPGPLTLVLDDPEGRFPPGVRSAAGGVAVRRSPHPFVEALLQRWPHPLLSTSANRPGEPPARSAEDAEAAVEGRPGIHRLWVLDGGPLVGDRPSTVVDCTGRAPRLLREGAVPAGRILPHLAREGA